MTYYYLSQSPAERGDIGFAGTVHRHTGIGTEGSDRGNEHQLAAPDDMGQHHIGHRRQGPDIQVHHTGLSMGLHLAEIAQIAAAGVVDQQVDLRLFRSQLCFQRG